MYTYIELKLMKFFRRLISGPEVSRRLRLPEFERVSP
jgi:hypothetical protein